MSDSESSDSEFSDANDSFSSSESDDGSDGEQLHQPVIAVEDSADIRGCCTWQKDQVVHSRIRPSANFPEQGRPSIYLSPETSPVDIVNMVLDKTIIGTSYI